MKRVIACWIAAVLLGGCADGKVLEKVGFMRTIAYDVAGEDHPDKLKVTVSIPLSNQKQTLIHSTIAKTTEEAMLVFNRQNNRQIVKGQLRQILFGERLAQQGLGKHVGLILRDPSVGSRVHVLVVEGDTEEMLRRSYSKQATTGEYIDNLIRTEVRAQDIPDTNIYRFVRDYFDEGIEPVATIIRGGEEHLIIEGIALFKGDRMVGRVKPEDKMLLGMLRDNVHTGSVFLDLSKSEKSGMTHLSSRRKVQIESSGAPQDGKPFKATIRLSVKGSLLEYVGERSMRSDRVQEELEKKMAGVVQKRCQALVREMQKLGTDSIGIGQYARRTMNYSEWSRLDWNETFAKADIRVKVDVKIKDYGKMR